MAPTFAASFWTQSGLVFFMFFIAHALSAAYAPIQDCDEVFNFWEPTHYLNHGFGMQTWELSPVYAIRSWLYVSLHAILIVPASYLPLLYEAKSVEFYFLRFIFAIACSICETRLFQRISKTMNPRVAISFLVISVSSAGQFHAATAYLPSTFAMYTTMTALVAFLEPPRGSKLAQGLMWLAVGTILGWPFVAVLCLPFVFEEVISIFSSYGNLRRIYRRLFDGLIRSLIVLVSHRRGVIFAMGMC